MPDSLIRDIKVIQRTANQNENEDFRFRTFLKMSDRESSEIDRVVHKTTERVWSQIDCKTCANCCKVLTINLEEADIERLALGLEMSIGDFTQRYVAETKDFEGTFKHLASKPCPFLKDNLCTVYEHRPDVCRGYPYLHKDEFRSRTLAMIQRVEECPIVFNVWESLKEQFRFRRRP
ncbi:MAG: YkgJ family cysteine cluster protein [Armatimonadetes bacterium]|nr:YkgJ family cysteine cluster protein [Armatimonadota bacterium]